MIKDLVPWLRKPDRPVVISWCRLHVKAEAAYAALDAEKGGGFVLNKAGATVDSPNWTRWMQAEDKLFRLEQKLGMTPADRTRIAPGFDAKNR